MFPYLRSYRCSLWMAIGITTLSLLKSPGIGVSASIGLDKVAHALMYAALSGLLWWEFLRKYRHSSAPLHHVLWGGVVIPAAFGGLMELAQAILTGYRSADWADFVANLIGILAATYWGYRAWRRQSVR